MISECIVLQSAGSLSMAVLALIMSILQVVLFLRTQQSSKWYLWGAAIAFSGMLYAIGIFFEYNSPPGPVNRFGGLMEFTAIILLIHSVYGFTFAYFGMNGKRYHTFAGIFHVLIIILLWSSTYIIADRFIAHNNLIGLSKPFVEKGLGPIGPLFEVYGVIAGIGIITLWVRHKAHDVRHRKVFLCGMVFWLALGIHDGLVSMGMPSIQYLMEYGLFGFSVVVLWVVIRSYTDYSIIDRYRVATTLANDGIMLMQEEKTIFNNPAFVEIIGQSAARWSFQDFVELVVPEDRGLLVENYKKLMNSEENQVPTRVRIRRPDGAERIAEIRANLVEYKKRPAIFTAVRDITDSIREEEALRDSEEKLTRLKKMESLGLLAGGVAHDLNNVLSGIVGYPELILKNLPEDSRLRKPIETMQESGQKAVAIVQDLLTVARGVAINKEPVNLNNIIMAYLKSPEHKKLRPYHPGVKIREDLAEDLLNINGSPVHLGKIVMNLVSNACEAIKGNGNVVISTMNRYLDRPLKAYENVNDGEYAVLTVEDDGPGISPENLKRIFEPFFTKKVMGRSGTGLGLTVVWNGMQDHEGYIDITSGNGGTKFELYFPVTRESLIDKKLSVPLMDLCGNGETILVIDDVESQRAISSQMLEALKYKAMSVAGGEEAIEYLKQNSVDLLLLDMIMDPGINGLETYRRIKEIHPHQKAVIVSGFAATDHVKETLRLGAACFLRKPLMPEELGIAVKEALKATTGT
jgi:PAS domain S-box-containing protein